ncbi:MAG: hypothetical protein QM750_20335 [Rubrivivax sp.]
MKRSCGAGLALLALVPGAGRAQTTDVPLYDGRWTVSIQDSEAGYRSARLELADFAGFWQDTSPAKAVKARACAGKRFKITVQRSRGDELEFMVWGSSVSTACPDLPVLLKPVDDKTLEGTIGEQGRVRATRRR